LRYSGDTLASALVVTPSEEPANVIRIDMPRDNSLWYGLALFNPGPETASVFLVQYGPNRELLYEENLTESLGHHDKLLGAISQLPLVSLPGAYIEVISSQPVNTLQLSAWSGKDGKLQLVQEMPLGRTKNMIRYHSNGGFAPIDQVIEISEGILCRSITLGKTTQQCAKIPMDRLTQLENLIGDLDLLDLEVVLTEEPTSNCADSPLVTVEIYKDGKQNFFSYDFCDLPLRTNSEAVEAFTAELNDLTAALLDPEESTTP
jgi:hypothetical protein